MLKVFKMRRSGFNQSVSVGESIVYDGKKFIIIEIGSLKARVFQDAKLEMIAVCQQVGMKSEFERYKRYFTFARRYNMAKERFPDVCGSGELIGDCGRNKDMVMRVLGIKKMYYEHVDLVVEYTAELIKPWSDNEVEQALKQERLSKFKVIQSKEGKANG